jgi:energy-coupling factor transporter ATP-binding protein EcfA2
MNAGTVAAILGSNASGKTNVLRAIWLMATMVTESHQRWKPGARLPHEPFFAAPHSTQETMFDLDFMLAGERYQYGFRFTAERVTEEWLYSFPKHRPRLLFERDPNRDEEYRFGRALRGKTQVIADLTRDNSLFLAAAAANNHPQLSPLAEWFDKIGRSTPEERKARVKYGLSRAKGNDLRRRRTLDLLRSADLGIEDVRLIDQAMDDETRAKITSVMRTLHPDAEIGELDWDELAQEVQFAHRTEDGVSFLGLSDESDGTRAWLALIGTLLDVLEDGRLLLVDELDASLHPRLTSEVVQIFHDPALNATGAQLIFTTHDPSLMGTLLGDAPLRRDEVWLTEKGRDGGTRLYPLTDFRPRKAENLERGYLQGRYGGVPFVDSPLVLDAFRGDSSASA